MIPSTSLIPINQSTIQNEVVQSVNARDLHVFLESKQDFSDWIKNRIDEYGFIEGNEFSINLGKTSNRKGGRPSKEYTLTLDMAKELAMVERNAKGKQARRYFIECEKKLKEAHQQNIGYLISPNSLNMTAIKLACATSIAATHLMMSDLDDSAFSTSLVSSLNMSSLNTLTSSLVDKSLRALSATSLKTTRSASTPSSPSFFRKTSGIAITLIPLQYQNKRQMSTEKIA
ncbi:MAG: antA/AntB antirepressor family protein [Nitrospirae bacterium]|nr:antA/AntB antirepressor family protein [Nitrospirota bacterium]